MKCLLWMREKKNNKCKLWLRLNGGKEKMYQVLECVAEMSQDVPEEK